MRIAIICCATALIGMRHALRAPSSEAQLARIDGNRLPRDLPCATEAIIGGDAIEPAIMAEVARDRAMCALHAEYPQYGFDRHKGYPSPVHLAALSEHGPCPQYRRNFAPILRAMDAHDGSPCSEPAPIAAVRRD